MPFGYLCPFVGDDEVTISLSQYPHKLSLLHQGKTFFNLFKTTGGVRVSPSAQNNVRRVHLEVLGDIRNRADELEGTVYSIRARGNFDIRVSMTDSLEGSVLAGVVAPGSFNLNRNGPPAPLVRAPVEPLQTSTPPEPSRRVRAKPRGAVRLAGSLGWGDLPSAGGGLGLAFALRLGRFQAELTGGGWFLRSVKLNLAGSSGAVFNLWSLGTRAGYVVPAGRRLEVPLLFGFEAGQVHVRGVRLIGPGQARTPWFAVVVSPGLTIIPREFIAIVIGLDLLVPVTRPRFVVENGSEIFRPRPIDLRGTLGLEFRFPARRSRSR